MCHLISNLLVCMILLMSASFGFAQEIGGSGKDQKTKVLKSKPFSNHIILSCQATKNQTANDVKIINTDGLAAANSRLRILEKDQQVTLKTEGQIAKESTVLFNAGEGKAKKLLVKTHVNHNPVAYHLSKKIVDAIKIVHNIVEDVVSVNYHEKKVDQSIADLRAEKYSSNLVAIRVKLYLNNPGKERIFWLLERQHDNGEWWTEKIVFCPPESGLFSVILMKGKPNEFQTDEGVVSFRLSGENGISKPISVIPIENE